MKKTLKQKTSSINIPWSTLWWVDYTAAKIHVHFPLHDSIQWLMICCNVIKDSQSIILRFCSVLCVGINCSLDRFTLVKSISTSPYRFSNTDKFNLMGDFQLPLEVACSLSWLDNCFLIIRELKILRERTLLEHLVTKLPILCTLLCQNKPLL